MSDLRRLEELLAPPSTPGASAAPRLATRRPLRPRRARLLATRASDVDPLTGHRGVAGSAVAARIGDLVLACEISAAPVRRLTGQLSGGDDLAGTLVHVRTEDGVALGCARGTGEIVMEIPDGEVLRIDVELEDGTWVLDRPFRGGR